VSFGTSGHRCSSLRGSFTETHIRVITQAICDYRRAQRIDGPLHLGKDTHALSSPAERTALEVLAANGVDADPAQRRSHAHAGDLAGDPRPQPRPHGAPRRRDRRDALPQPTRGRRLQVQPPSGGPADTEVTRWVQDRANELLRRAHEVRRIPHEAALRAPTTHAEDFGPQSCVARSRSPKPASTPE
jgi:phosphoglucomutase